MGTSEYVNVIISQKGKNMEEKITLYDENLRLHRLEVRLELAREYVADALKHDTFPQMDRTLCLLLDIDYDEVIAEREVKA